MKEKCKVQIVKCKMEESASMRSAHSALCTLHFALPRRGFTLIECLAAVLLIAIVIPVVDRGIAAATLSAKATQHRTEAAGLAQSELSTLIVTGNWQGSALSGDFGPNWPDYKWQATVTPWVNDTQGVGLQQLDVTVTWTDRNRPESLMLSTLVYQRPTSSS
jgi:general secretion pathway protein I